MSAPTLREALTEIRDRIKGHPAYADLTEAEEESIGGDTAELSYLARVADGALAQSDPLELVANLLGEYGLQALDVVAASKALQDEPFCWLGIDGNTGDFAECRPGHGTPVFVSTQQPAEAAPLTDELIQEIAEDHANSFVHGGVRFDEFDSRGFARAIERAHKIGGPL